MHTHTKGVGKIRFTVVHMEKYTQIAIAVLTQKHLTTARRTWTQPRKSSDCQPLLSTHACRPPATRKHALVLSAF